MKYIESENEYGQTNQAETVIKIVWASVEPLTGKEYLEAEREANEQNYKIYTRYIAELRDVNLIIDFKGRKFSIESVINYQERNEMLLFMCKERVGDAIA